MGIPRHHEANGEKNRGHQAQPFFVKGAVPGKELERALKAIGGALEKRESGLLTGRTISG